MNLTFENIGSSAQNIMIINNSSPYGLPNAYYSLDEGTTWTLYPAFDSEITVQPNATIQWKGTNNFWGSDNSVQRKFDSSSSCRWKLSGDITSLLDGGTNTCQSITTDYCFNRLFSSMGIVDAGELILDKPLMGLGIYNYLLSGNTKLTVAPKLPVMDLSAAPSAYRGMFNYNTSLTRPPLLPATNLGTACYYEMFRSCAIKVSTTQDSTYRTEYRIPIKGTGTSATQATYFMFYGTAGTFTGNPDINTTYYIDTDAYYQIAVVDEPIVEEYRTLNNQVPTSTAEYRGGVIIPVKKAILQEVEL